MEMSPLQQQFVQQLLPIIVTLLSTILTLLLGYATTYLKEKSQNEKVNQAINIAEETAAKIVMSFEHTIVSEILKASADGKFTEEEKNYIKQKAASELKTQLKPGVKKSLELIYSNLDIYFEEILNTAVKQVKSEYPSQYRKK